MRKTNDGDGLAWKEGMADKMAQPPLGDAQSPGTALWTSAGVGPPGASVLAPTGVPASDVEKKGGRRGLLAVGVCGAVVGLGYCVELGKRGGGAGGEGRVVCGVEGVVVVVWGKKKGRMSGGDIAGGVL